MAILTIKENPSVVDTVVFDIDAPGADGCFESNPYKVNNLTIYYVGRDFSSGNLQKYESTDFDAEQLKLVLVAEALACADPTEENIKIASKKRQDLNKNKSINTFFFKEAIPVHIVGNEEYPAWLSTDLDNSFLERVETNEEEELVYGKFKYRWEPKGMREGDYFICWTWTPLIAGSTLSQHYKFSLSGSTETTTSIPTHYTDPKKYTTLLERYTPEVFKSSLADSDVSADVIDRTNKTIAMGFNVLENLTNQLVDLHDPNALNEFLLPYLSNYFGLKLRTDDPTRWRGQIKRAVPLYKKKGTKNGLHEALEHSGIVLNKITQLWQVISSYTWQESFFYDGSNDFILEKVALELDENNFEIWLRTTEEDWVSLSSSYVSFSTVDNVTTMSWEGEGLDGIDGWLPITLMDGDELKVLYLYENIPNETAQTIESYIRLLPLMDNREERDQTYPPKNWNVRVLPEDDVMFNIVIPNRNPFHEYLVYGKIRTEFPYSENIYHMDEYNGSIRNSKNPCDIDKNFIDPCTACVSSSYNIMLEIEELSGYKIAEAKEIIQENSPFHAVLHTFNFTGGFNEFVESPTENLEFLTTYSGHDFVVASGSHNYFNRLMMGVERGYPRELIGGILRDMLAVSSSVLVMDGIAYNNEILMFCPSVVLSTIGVNSTGESFISIKSPSPISGDYTVSKSDGNTVRIDSPIDEDISGSNCDSIFQDSELNTCAFVFDLNNFVQPIYNTLCNISQNNVYKLIDSSKDFTALGIKTLDDVEKGLADEAWRIGIAEYGYTTYPIRSILSDGSLLLDHSAVLPQSNDTVEYDLMEPLGNSSYHHSVISEGTLTVSLRAIVTALSPYVTPVSEVLEYKNCYQKIGDYEYHISGIVEGTTDQYYISGYDEGDANGLTIYIWDKIVTEKIGYLSHKGLKLKLEGNIKTILGLQSYSDNNLLDNNLFQENFIVFIDDVSYWITEIDGNNPAGFTTIILSGANTYWKTLTDGGSEVSVEFFKYEKQGATIPGQRFHQPEHTFQIIDRNGSGMIDGVISSNIENPSVISFISFSDEEPQVSSLNSKKDELNDFIKQEEEVSFKIDYKDNPPK